MMNFRYAFQSAAAALSAAALISASSFSVTAAPVEVPAGLREAVTATFTGDEVTDSLGAVTDLFRGGRFRLGANVSMPADGLTLNADFSADLAVPALSLTGTLDGDGVSIDFQEYMDAAHIVLSMPMFLQQAVSYDFTNDNPTGGLAPMAAEVAALNEQIRQVVHTIAEGSPLSGSFSETWVSAVQAQAAGLAFEEKEGRECQTGSGTVTCTGQRLEMSGKQLAGIMDTVLHTPMAEGGLSFSNLVSTLSGNIISVYDFDDIPDMFRPYKIIDFDFYYGGGYLRELDTIIDGERFAMCFAADDIPWHHTVLTDGVNRAELTADTTGTTTTYRFLEDGKELLAVSCSTADGSFRVQAGGTALLRGNAKAKDGGFTFSSDLAGASVRMRANNKPEIVPVEGSTIEITTASEEELSDLLGLAALFSAGS